MTSQTKSGPHAIDGAQRALHTTLKGKLRDVLPVADTRKINEDDLLFRFLIAQKYDVDKAATMFREYVAYRKEYDVEGIFDRVYPEPVRKQLSGYHMTDKDGHPVYYECPNPDQISELLKSQERTEIVKWHIAVAELGREKAKLAGVDRITVVMDLKHISLGIVSNPTVLKMLKELAHIDQHSYPENMRTLCIINPPRSFAFIWRVVKPLLEERVQKKIKVMDRFEALFDVIPFTKIPRPFGGMSDGFRTVDEELKARAVAGDDDDDDGTSQASSEEEEEQSGHAVVTKTTMRSISGEAVAAAAPTSASASTGSVRTVPTVVVPSGLNLHSDPPGRDASPSDHGAAAAVSPRNMSPAASEASLQSSHRPESTSVDPLAGSGNSGPVPMFVAPPPMSRAAAASSGGHATGGDLHSAAAPPRRVSNAASDVTQCHSFDVPVTSHSPFSESPAASAAGYSSPPPELEDHHQHRSVQPSAGAMPPESPTGSASGSRSRNKRAKIPADPASGSAAAASSPVITIVRPTIALSVTPPPPSYGDAKPWRKCVELFHRPLPLLCSVLRRDVANAGQCSWHRVVLHIDPLGDTLTVSDQLSMRVLIKLIVATETSLCYDLTPDQVAPIAPPEDEPNVFCIQRAQSASHFYFATPEGPDRQNWVSWLWTAYPHTHLRGSEPLEGDSAAATSPPVSPRRRQQLAPSPTAAQLFSSPDCIAAF